MMEINDIEPLRFSKDIDNIRAFTVLRGTVDAQNYYSGINLCDYTGDDIFHINYCRESLCELMGIELNKLIMPRQTHSARAEGVDDDFLVQTDKDRSERLQGVDALVSTVPGVAIGVNTADCVPIVLRDANKGIIAVAHAGWKGTVAAIVKNTVEMMEALGAEAKDIEVAIGASICQDCFEVGDEVVLQFSEAGFPINDICRRNPLTKKAHIDLWKANVWLLENCGVKAENIVVSGNCTRCNPERYFSARRLGINSGRTFTFIVRSI